jgi:homoisocitrate dehydrogenase
MEDADTAITERVITRQASARITRMAAEIAMQRGKKLTVIHKANVVRIGDGLFREAALNTLKDFPELEVEEQLVDSMAYKMVMNPQQYDVVVAPNLYGDILSDLGAALVGGLGTVPSSNIGPDFCLAEPVHGSAPDIEGQGIANPVASIRAAALMIANLSNDFRPASEAIQASVDSVLADGPRTPDLGGSDTTQDMTNAVKERLAV